jgi:hypothetical protein
MSSAADERGDWITEAVEMRRTHVDNRHIRLLAGGEAADLMVEVPRARRVERRQPEHVTVAQLRPRAGPVIRQRDAG